MLETNLEKVQASYSDLVHNYSLFHEKYSSIDFLDSKLFPDWPDDSNYSNVQHIDDFLKNATEEDLGLSHTVAVPISYIFSSEKELGGCDRPYWQSNQGEAESRKHLNKKTLDGNLKGYSSSNAEILSGYLRPLNSGDHPLLGPMVLVKYIGNGRVWKKLLANKGEDSLVKMEIRFHDEGLSQKDYITLEADGHATDAGDRSSQNEEHKFASQFRSGDPDAVHTFNFLRKCQINYGTFMQQEGEIGSEEWMTITSIQGIKAGQGNGFFKKYDEPNVVWALDTIKKVAEITGEKVFGNTPMEAFAMMFYCYTEFGLSKGSKGLFTKSELQQFFIDFFEAKNRKSDSWIDTCQGLKLADISQSGSVKNVAYINSQLWWDDIQVYYRHINQSKNTFSIDSECNRQFLKFCSERFLVKDIKSKLS